MAGGDTGVRKLGTLSNTSKHIHALISLGGRGKVSVTDWVHGRRLSLVMEDIRNTPFTL